MARTRLPAPTTPGARTEAGFALPLVCVALTLVSLLVTTSLLGASAEGAMTDAHAEAARARCAAEGALAGFVAERASELPAGDGERLYAPPGGDTIRIRVLALGEWTAPGDSTLRILSLVARPLRGEERGVAVLIKLLLPPPDALERTAAGPAAAPVAGVGGTTPNIRAVGAWTQVEE